MMSVKRQSSAFVHFFSGELRDAQACIVSEELSCADPGFALSFLAHSLLYVNNVNLNASEAQKQRYEAAMGEFEKAVRRAPAALRSFLKCAFLARNRRRRDLATCMFRVLPLPMALRVPLPLMVIR